MKKGLIVLLALGMIASLQSCFIDDGNIGCVRGNKNVEFKELFMSEFEKVSVNGDADVFITQGPDFKVEVETDGNLIEHINQDVRNDTWNIEFDRCVNRVTRFHVFITMPTIESLNISGSGELFGENDFVGDDLELRISGSGKMDLFYEGNSIDSRVTGSGDIQIGGFVDRLDYDVSGSGDLNGFGLEAKEAKITVRGSGDVEVTVTDLLIARITGSGDIFFKGNPTVEASISGSGDVVKVD